METSATVHSSRRGQARSAVSRLVGTLLVVTSCALVGCSTGGHLDPAASPTSSSPPPTTVSSTTVSTTLYSLQSLLRTTTSTLPTLEPTMPLDAARIRDIAGFERLNYAIEAIPGVILAQGTLIGTTAHQSHDAWASLVRRGQEWNRETLQILHKDSFEDRTCWTVPSPAPSGYPYRGQLIPDAGSLILDCWTGGSNHVGDVFVISVVDGQARVVFYAACNVTSASPIDDVLELDTSGAQPGSLYRGLSQPTFILRWSAATKRFELDSWAKKLAPEFDRFCKHTDTYATPA